MTVQDTFQLALQRHQAGQLAEAEALYRQVLAQQPDHADALNLLGAIAFHVGRLDTAIELTRRAIVLNPLAAEYHFNLGTALGKSGNRQQAIAAFRRAISLRPSFAQAHYNLGVALVEDQKFDQAIAAYRQAVQLNPDLPDSHFNLALTLFKTHRFDEALAAFDKAIVLRPDWAEAHNNRGNALLELGQMEEAISAYNQSARLRSDLVESRINIGNAYYAMGQWDRAGRAYRDVLAVWPGNALAHWNLGTTLLMQGDYEQGWPEYEWHCQVKEPGELELNFSQPKWEGGDLHGRSILLHDHQGFGDTFHFVRYVQQVRDRGGKITLACRAELLPLMRNVNGIEQCVAIHGPLPGAAVHCPLMSLPRIFQTTLNNMPSQVPYLQADPALRRQWQARLPKDHRLKVGLSWTGKSRPDPKRSVPLELLAPLAQVPGVAFFSLQKTESLAQARSAPPGLDLTDWSGELKDFADTAALMANLDLIITIDSAVAHLAGAMGKRVWVLLKNIPDWRWMLQRSDSPWYPTMRLFRQPRPGDWQTPIAELVESLKKEL